MFVCFFALFHRYHFMMPLMLYVLANDIDWGVGKVGGGAWLVSEWRRSWWWWWWWCWWLWIFLERKRFYILYRSSRIITVFLCCLPFLSVPWPQFVRILAFGFQFRPQMRRRVWGLRTALLVPSPHFRNHFSPITLLHHARHCASEPRAIAWAGSMR